MDRCMDRLLRPLLGSAAEHHAESAEDHSRSSESRAPSAKKGRRRRTATACENIFALITTCVVPKWTEYLRLKTTRRLDATEKPRQDTFWK